MSDELTARDDGHEWSVRTATHRKVAVCTGSAAEANARRLAAAWNHCKAFSTELLESIGGMDAESLDYIVERFDQSAPAIQRQIVAVFAERLAIVKGINAAFLDAITGDDNPALHRLAWLENLLTEVCESQFIESHDDPSSAGDMVRECRELAKRLRVAMEKVQVKL